MHAFWPLVPIQDKINSFEISARIYCYRNETKGGQDRTKHPLYLSIFSSICDTVLLTVVEDVSKDVSLLITAGVF